MAVVVFGCPVFGMILVTVIFSVEMLTATADTAEKSDQAISVLKHVDCERQCPYYYFPICATNGKPNENRMFVNICEMHAWNCDVEKKYRRTRNNQCKDYREYVDDAWLNSNKPTKIPKPFIQHGQPQIE
ncbi:uncharacterized protein LOC116345404 [Contarinia nasturtii]|uniref:uncharacterized protein LOC116345404 n=1 Tax=Contarinia nasturtii TaxID=265458 RepID=UPI0012D3D1AE|nr:uncharacterized protein LOC116345404 [Contarinia nasturtii]